MIDNIFEIKKEKDYAISKIEQLCFIATALFFLKKDVCNWADYIYNNPEKITSPYNKELILRP